MKPKLITNIIDNKDENSTVILELKLHDFSLLFIRVRVRKCVQIDFTFLAAVWLLELGLVLGFELELPESYGNFALC